MLDDSMGVTVGVGDSKVARGTTESAAADGSGRDWGVEINSCTYKGPIILTAISGS